MRIRLLTAVPFLLGLGAQAQGVQNALDLDGVNDHAVVNNAGSLMSGATGYTLTCWVRLMNPTVAIPDYDGICGFRDFGGADFCFMRESATKVRAHFRNSINVNHTMNLDVAQVGQWQHLAMVYDGATLTMYNNGTVPTNGSIPASGWMSNLAGPFFIGKLPYNVSLNIFLDGQIDEVSMWSTALSAQEIQCIYSSGIDAASPGLQLYYKMDQGIAGGNNTAITTLADATGHIAGTITGLAMTQTASNFVSGPSIGTALIEQICPGESYTFNGQVLNAEGMYTASFPGSGACDSLVTLALDVTNVNTNVVQQNGMLISQAVGAQYQWLDCANGYSMIPGASTASYTPTTTGAFAVEVTQNGCTDTSACHSNVGLDELDVLDEATVVYDPLTDNVVVSVKEVYNGLSLELLDASGRSLRHLSLRSQRSMVDVAALPSGVYLVQLSRADRRNTLHIAIIR